MLLWLLKKNCKSICFVLILDKTVVQIGASLSTTTPSGKSQAPKIPLLFLSQFVDLLPTKVCFITTEQFRNFVASFCYLEIVALCGRKVYHFFKSISAVCFDHLPIVPCMFIEET